MNARRTVWFGAASVAVATWLAASTSGPPQPASSVQPSRTPPIDRYTDTLHLEADRLHARLAPTATPTLRRDLFRFSGERRAAVAPARAAGPDTAAPIVAEAAPPLKLIGIAEDAGPDGPVRTAVVSGLGDVFLVKPGDMIAGRYRVQAVSHEAVQLIESATDVETTLALR
jgi:hypothetical protein